MKDVLRSAILAIVVLAPMWLLANELSGDEFVKSAAGLASGAVILTALKLLEKQIINEGTKEKKS